MTGAAALWNVVVLCLESGAAAAEGFALAEAAGTLQPAAADVHLVAVPSVASQRAVPPVAAHRIEHPALGEGRAVDALAQAGQQALEALPLSHAQTLVLLPPGDDGETLAAQLAWRTGGATLGRCVDLQLEDGGVCGRRSVFGGKASMQLHATAPHVFATWRPPVGPAASPKQPPAAWTPLPIGGPLDADAPRRTLDAADAGLPLEGARVVVSGGRGMQGPDGFVQLARLAQALGAAVGGSLPTVDAGWIPVSRQIGQSGKFVAPRVYLAVGLSGTLQHLAGVSDDSLVMAINSDPQAAIFNVASVGAVAEWQELLPHLIDRLERAGSPASPGPA